MFERFTGLARNVVVHAANEADTLGLLQVSMGCMLLALCKEEVGITPEIFKLHGISYDNALAAIQAGFKPYIAKVEDDTDPGTSSMKQFSAPAKIALEMTHREALQLGCNYIGPEHILLGIIRTCEQDNTAKNGERLVWDYLANHGLDLKSCRAAIVGLENAKYNKSLGVQVNASEPIKFKSFLVPVEGVYVFVNGAMLDLDPTNLEAVKRIVSQQRQAKITTKIIAQLEDQ